MSIANVLPAAIYKNIADNSIYPYQKEAPL
jgi:hypothetical protein